MTNGRGAGMASFMTKKKKYKFQVDVCLEELLEVPFVSAVLFAKLRLLDGGSFQDHSSREEVKDHKVKWNAKFSFPCKMLANASTGVLERCVLRISVRKESKGGRSFNKLGFVDLNLAEYAGAGKTYKKALLEGYDTRRRQDNSMLKFSIEMNMLSGDILFKVPTSVSSTEDPATGSETRFDEFSGGSSLGGSIASASSGFGSLPKKRPALLSSELVIGHTLPETNQTENSDLVQNSGSTAPGQEQEDNVCEPGHSRNSSNTSQLSKGSGYSSIHSHSHSHSHSRQSSSGDSGHIRGLLLPQRPIRKTQNPLLNNTTTTTTTKTTTLTNSKFIRVNTYPNRLKIPNTLYSTPSSPLYSTSSSSPSSPLTTISNNSTLNNSRYFTAIESPQLLNSDDDYKTPDETLQLDVFSHNFIQLQKSSSTSVVERLKNTNNNNNNNSNHNNSNGLVTNRISEPLANKSNLLNIGEGVLRSKSDFEIPQISPIPKKENKFSQFFKSDSLCSFLTPRPKRKQLTAPQQSTPIFNCNNNNNNKSPQLQAKQKLHSLPETRTTSLNSLQSANYGNGNQNHIGQRSMPHRKMFECSSGGKLAPPAISPDDLPLSLSTTTASSASVVVSSDFSQSQITTMRRPSVTTNPSSSSLVLSETGSLDRAKAAYERRKKQQQQDCDPLSASNTISTSSSVQPGRVEITRVNPDHLIEELLKNTNLEPTDDSAETSGLQLFIAKDGTAALGNHEVKSQMSQGVQVFKQVVMDDNR